MVWKVPVTIATSKNPAALKFVLDKGSTTVTVEGVGPDDWILVRSPSTAVKSVLYKMLFVFDLS